LYLDPDKNFLTSYCGTFHGISAASGKLGSVITPAFIPYLKFNKANSTILAWLLIGFVFVIVIRGVAAWA
jgi:hypothetical protein